MSFRKISVSLSISRNTVKRVIKSAVTKEVVTGQNKIKIDPELLKSVYEQCEGWGGRIYEIITKDHKIAIGYSTLMRRIKENGLGVVTKERCLQAETLAGVEMQHDTSPYKIKIGGKETKIVASILYYRYSKQRYLKFYPHFTRFKMKCFFYEALTYYKYAAPTCVVDNTNLAVLRGTGKKAIFVPEMITLGKNLGFSWLAHEKNHSNRKAGEERSFWTLESNFFPGRTFESWEDLNAQAFNWATVILAERAQTKSKIIPNIWFEQEKPLLKPLPDFINEPYLEHDRGVNQYGRLEFQTNFYWVPGNERFDVKVYEYRNRIKIYRGREELIEYQLPQASTRGKNINPAGFVAEKQPKENKISMEIEEQRLRAEAPEINEFLDRAILEYVTPRLKSLFLKELSGLFRKLSKPMFIETIERAKKYGVIKISVIERIASQLLRDSLLEMPIPEIANEYETRELYKAGRMSAAPDFSAYKDLLSQKNITEVESNE